MIHEGKIALDLSGNQNFSRLEICNITMLLITLFLMTLFQLWWRIMLIHLTGVLAGSLTVAVAGNKNFKIFVKIQ